MELPFEIAICQVEEDLGTSVRGISENVRVRSRTRQALKHRKVTTRRKKKHDILWQQNPDRILEYRPSHLHYYGWIPLGSSAMRKPPSSKGISPRPDVGLADLDGDHPLDRTGVEDRDLAALVAMFGTAFLGAIFNYGMVVVFITLVINRWWSIHSAYAKLMGTTTDLCMVVDSAIQHEHDPDDRRTNLVTRTDAQNDDFLKSSGLRTLLKSIVISMKKLVCFPNSPKEDQGFQELTQALSNPRTIALEDMLDEGFLNEDERTLLTAGEAEVMPAYHLVYYWTQALVRHCRTAELIISAPQMLPLMLNKINTIVESGSQIITSVNSQLPYPYVHLVSFVVHMYLLALATWFGSYLHTGQRGLSMDLRGRSIYFDDPSVNYPLPGGGELFMRYHQGVKLCQKGLALNVETTCTAFLKSRPVLELFQKSLDAELQRISDWSI